MLISTNLPGTPRPLRKLNQLLGYITKNVGIVKTRYQELEFHTGGPIEFVVNLLTQIDDESVLTRDMLDVHLDTIVGEVETISAIFDIAYSGGKPKTNCFLQGSSKEIFIPTTGILGDEVTVLDDWNKWKNIQPIKLISHDSDELKIYWYNQISFDLEQPTYAVFAIDVEALLVKYYIYLRHNGISLSNPDVHKFVQEEVVPFFYDDLVDIWITRTFLKVSDESYREKLISDDISAQRAYLETIAELRTFYANFSKGTYRIGDILHTKVYPNGRNMIDQVELFEERYSSGVERRHVGFTLLKMANIVNIVVNALNDTKNRGLETGVIRKLQYDVRLLSRTNWQSHVKEPLIIDEVDSMVAGVDTLAI